MIIGIAIVPPLPENIGRISMNKFVNGVKTQVPLDPLDPNRTASELEYWRDRGMPITEDIFKPVTA